MKKYILLVLLTLLFSFASYAKADVPSNTFFLGDGKGYDVNGVQTYFCLADSNCYDISGVFAFIRQAQTQLADLQTRVGNLENTVNQTQPIQPQATSTPASTPIEYATGEMVYCSSSSSTTANCSAPNGNTTKVIFNGKVVYDGSKPFNGRQPVINQNGGTGYGDYISGLTPDTTYTYQVVITEAGKQDSITTQTFSTPK